VLSVEGMQIRHMIKEFPAKRLFSFYSSSYLLNKLNHEKVSYIIYHIHFFYSLSDSSNSAGVDATAVQAF
jgi:hypothetical protein